MSFSNKNKNIERVEFKGFGGIDLRAAAKGGNKAKETVNFRILPDGSLKKRNGYRYLTKFPSKIRAIMSGYFGSEFLTYVLSGSAVYKYDFSTNTSTLIGNIKTSTGEATIFYYVGRIYLIDGQEIYDVRETEVVRTEGYAPLLGKDWGAGYPGEVNEPLNMLTPKARITYIIKDETGVFLPTLYPVKQVDAMYINGKLADPCDYDINTQYTTVDNYKLKKNDCVELYLTYEDGTVDRSAVIKNIRAAIFGGASNSRVFMWGGEHKTVMYSSGYVTYDNLQHAEKIYSGCGALYFPKGYEFNVGDGMHEINAVNRHYDRLILFTDDETWMADSQACGVEAFPAMSINVSRGCISPLGTAKIGNDPVSVSRGQIVRWTTNTDELNDCNAYSISNELEGLLDDSFFKNAIVHEDKYNREILFGDPNSGNGRMFVYGEDNKQWYIYEGIYADKFFDGPEGVGFIRENKIYLFDKDMEFDMLSSCGGQVIEAHYCTHPIDFGYPERKKRLSSVDLVADTKEGDLKLEFCSDNKIKEEKTVTDDGGEGVRSYHERLSSDRFVRSALRIDADPNTTQRIYNMTVTVKP